MTGRLTEPRSGQLKYYRGKTDQAGSWLLCARITFYLGSAGALVATTAKLAVLLHWLHVDESAHATTTSFLACCSADLIRSISNRAGSRPPGARRAGR